MEGNNKGIVLGFLGLMVFLIIWGNFFSSKTFTFNNSIFLYHTDPPLLILDLERETEDNTSESWHIINLKTGTRQAKDRFRSYDREMIGISDEYIWAEDGDDSIIGVSIQDLSVQHQLELEHPEIKDIISSIRVDGKEDGFYIYTLKGRAYELSARTGELVEIEERALTKSYYYDEPYYMSSTRHHSSMLPTVINGEKVLDGAVLYDVHTSERIILDEGDALIYHQDLLGEKGRALVSRVRQNEALWTLTQDDLFDDPDPTNRIKSCSMSNGVIYLVFAPNRARGKVYVTALQADSGEKIWSLRVE